MSDLIAMDKEYRTRDGRTVEVLKVDMNHADFPIAVVVTNSEGRQFVGTRTRTGRMCISGENRSDLIEVKPRIKQDVWVNVYPNRFFVAHKYKENAEAQADGTRIACVKVEIDCEHGEGL